MAVTDQLDLRDRILARAVSTEVFIRLERIDEADEVYDYQAAETNYQQATGGVMVAKISVTN